MESAIDTHLTCPRTLSRRVPDDYQPPFPMFVGRADTALQQVVMAYLGVQYADEAKRPDALAALRHMVGTFEVPDGPVHHDLTHHVDNQDHHNLMVVALLGSTPRRTAAGSARRRSRAGGTPTTGWHEGLGYFREIVAPRVDQFETVVRLPGGSSRHRCRHGRDQRGGQRARLLGVHARAVPALADRLDDAGRGARPSSRETRQAGGRVVVRGHDNIALIRSGQDWIEQARTSARSTSTRSCRASRTGWTSCATTARAVGCYSNRFVRSIDLDGNELPTRATTWATGSLAGPLERWAESHPTHLRIFATFFRVAAAPGEAPALPRGLRLRRPRTRLFEYINCHPATGMMRDARPTSQP